MKRFAVSDRLSWVLHSWQKHPNPDHHGNLYLLWRVIADKVDRVFPNVSPDIHPAAGVHSTANPVGGGPNDLRRQHPHIRTQGARHAGRRDLAWILGCWWKGACGEGMGGQIFPQPTEDLHICLKINKTKIGTNKPHTGKMPQHVKVP